jgi:hypothetical protein
VNSRLDIFDPKVEETVQLGVMGGDVEMLPDESLQQAGMIRHMIDDLGGREAVAVELAHKIVVLAAHPFVSSFEIHLGP